jgi:hypothetical protein
VRRLLTRGHERLSERQVAKLELGLRRGDPFGEVGAALAVKEQLRTMYATANLDDARSALTFFYEPATTSGTPEVTRLSRTVKHWES